MIEFELPAMSCGHCVGVVTQAVRSVDPQAHVDVDLERKTVQVESASDREALAASLSEAGYPPA